MSKQITASVSGLFPSATNVKTVSINTGKRYISLSAREFGNELPILGDVLDLEIDGVGYKKYTNEEGEKKTSKTLWAKSFRLVHNRTASAQEVIETVEFDGEL